MRVREKKGNLLAAGTAIVAESDFVSTGSYSVLLRRKLCICSSFFK